MRRSAVGLVCALSFGPLGAAAATPQQVDAWSGAYRLEWIKGERTARAMPAPSDVTIQRAPDADADKVPAEGESNLPRWTVTETGSTKEGATVRRFRPREYEDWGWADLHAAGRIECLDASHMFMCRTAPGTTITFGPEGPNRETLLAQTGVFGVVLHAGAFQLKKLGKK
ncbi:hypothetical protein [Variovorax sp. PAMC26660]|uniref:hypothetical protein n=1 Tax=Variovorax sp. PAMC26660 TaxID=2762322 RepID=UPI00164EB9D5|nr:hypothetical protein [Variovorax sp. PAMC26660]QNK66742.1 hypothetical protein H7F35_26725 [Variovorax sp. PAMC26660]